MATYTLTHLVNAWIEDRRWGMAGGGIGEEIRARYQRLADAFGVDLETCPSVEPDHDSWPEWFAAEATESFDVLGLFEMLEIVAKHAAAQGSPFHFGAEIPRELAPLHRRHHLQCVSLAAAMREQDEKILVELVQIIWGLPAGVTVELED